MIDESLLKGNHEENFKLIEEFFKENTFESFKDTENLLHHLNFYLIKLCDIFLDTKLISIYDDNSRYKPFTTYTIDERINKRKHYKLPIKVDNTCNYTIKVTFSVDMSISDCMVISYDSYNVADTIGDIQDVIIDSLYQLCKKFITAIKQDNMIGDYDKPVINKKI